MDRDRSYRTTAFGATYAVATPFHLSSFFSLYCLQSNGCPDSAALAGLLSLTINLPYLCGLGGDCIILRSDLQGILDCYNGTGRTGSGQSIDKFHAEGLTTIGRRGWGSAMIYGAPLALQHYSTKYDIDTRFVINLLAPDLNKGIIYSASLNYFVTQHSDDLRRYRLSPRWEDALLSNANQHAETAHNGSPGAELLQLIAKEGFESMYRGVIADRCCAAMVAHAEGYFRETDLTEFSAPEAATFSISFFNAKVEMVAFNTPWLELCALLTVIERFNQGCAPLFDERFSRYVCCAAGLIDRVVASRGMRRAISMLLPQQKALYNGIVAEVLAKLDESELHSVTAPGSDTVFMAAAASDGTVIGVTSSIFTPFGSMIDPGNIGALLSNRASSFSLDKNSWNSLQPNEPAAHTANALIVTTDRMKFTLGTTGGPVQVQVLSQLLYRIVALRQKPQAALEAPRFANMGYSAKHGRNIMLAEKRMGFSSHEFEVEQDLSPKLGVAQIAGVDMLLNVCFGATDPRGEGAALAL